MLVIITQNELKINKHVKENIGIFRLRAEVSLEAQFQIFRQTLFTLY